MSAAVLFFNSGNGGRIGSGPRGSSGAGVRVAQAQGVAGGGGDELCATAGLAAIGLECDGDLDVRGKVGCAKQGEREKSHVLTRRQFSREGCRLKIKRPERSRAPVSWEV